MALQGGMKDAKRGNKVFARKNRFPCVYIYRYICFPLHIYQLAPEFVHESFNPVLQTVGMNLWRCPIQGAGKAPFFNLLMLEIGLDSFWLS